MQALDWGSRLIVFASALTLVGGCTRANDNAMSGNGNGSGSPQSTPVDAKCGGIGIADTGCACPTAGARQPCWPGDPAQRGRGDCRDGVQTCQPPPAGSGESFGVQVWGACVGYTIGQQCVGPCTPSEFQGCTPDNGGKDHLSNADAGGVGGGPGGGGPGGGGPGGGGPGGGGPADCIPGAYRWCDDPVYCNWGQQTCTPNGTWGACVEVSARPGNCRGSSYNPQCCVNAGACCQGLQGLPPGFPSCVPYCDGGGVPQQPMADPSIGNCAGIVPMCK
jgi:hypothetical protein